MSEKDKAPTTFDVRVTERMLRKGEMTIEERDKVLAKLPDVTEKGTPVETKQPS